MKYIRFLPTGIKIEYEGDYIYNYISYYMDDKLFKVKDRDGIYFFEDDMLHRLDGPAVILFGGLFPYKEKWFYKNKRIDCNSLEEFQRKIKLLAFI